ncbi:MAG: hypothetical protein LBH93_05350 [Chitinispirillales bacterium]|nr:hypothetical protein [Chitinispirillales bacterium]
MFGRIKAVITFVAAAGMIAGASAQVAMQATQDSADGNRLVINGNRIFISGMNIAWNNFGSDVGDRDVSINPFVNQFTQIKAAGGNAVRWWLHTDAQNCPKINSNGEVTGIGSKTISNMRQVLDSAYSYGIVVSMCLFSFDLLKPEQKSDYSSYNLDNNYKFLTEPQGLQTYITKGLRPILQAIGNHPAIMCWEAFNEPEGMLPSNASGWGLAKSIPYSDIIRFTAAIAAEVHEQTLKMASTGIHEYYKNDYFTEYTDAKLKAAAGGNEKAYLDFYMVHHYPEWNSESPFKNPPSYWGLDRPILIGEFPARDWTPNNVTPKWKYEMTIVDAYEAAYDRGYLGAMSWSMTEGNTAKFGNFETTKPALENLYAKHKADIDILDRVIDIPSGDMAMKLTLTNLPAISSDWSELGVNKDLNFSGKSNLAFEMFIKEGSGANLDINVVVKVGNDWDWTEGPTLKLNDYEQGKWVDVTVPISSFGSGDLSAVKSVLFQYGAAGTPYSGEIYFDNIKLDAVAIADFNEFGSEWALDLRDKTGAVSSANCAVALAPRPGTSPVTHRAISKSAKPRAPIATVKGKVLSIAGGLGAGVDNSAMTVKLVNLKGKTVANFKAVGGVGKFELAKIPSGSYVVEMSAAGKRVGSSRVVVR